MPTAVVEELTPCPDPWAAARKLAHLPHLLVLDSADRQPDRGRYSYVAADPGWVFARRAEPAVWGLDVFAALARRLAPLGRPTLPGLPPFQGGLAGVFGYGLGRELERLPTPRHDEFRVWDCSVGLYDWVIAFDHAQHRGWLIAQPADPRRGDPGDRVRAVRALLAAPDPPPRPPYGPALPADALAPQFPLAGSGPVTSNFDRDGYVAAVRRAVEYVHAGDCFQVNLSQRLLAPLAGHPLALYDRLRRVSPAPFGCYFDAGEFQIVSASPERFVQASAGGEVATRPIKGTRPRGATVEDDAAQLRDLLANPKDRAENVMIVDLLRNDLGRVCTFGSVSVPAVCEPETYSHVHHLVSEVRGTLRPRLTAFDLLAAAFPGGSVTGAPKVRSMEIISELEPTARGPYCGCVGYVGFDGAADTNILIRTFTAARGWVQFPVGGGVVADSDPAREYEETLHKAAGLLRALPPA